MSATALRRVAGLFCVTVLALLTFGLVMLASTTSVMDHQAGAFYHTKRQALWLGLGLVACVTVAQVDYRRYRALAWPLFGFAAILLIAVLVFGKPINGAKRWLIFGSWQFQPSEFAKYALVIALAYWLEEAQRAPKGKSRPKIRDWRWGVLAPLGLAGGLAALVLKEPDLGTALLLVAVALVLMWNAGTPLRWMAVIAGGGLAGFAALWLAIFRYGLFHGSYQVQRILHWWRGDDPLGSNYQQNIAMDALASGGFWGVGLGNSRMKHAFLPEAHTDFILPIIGEELGLIATLAVVLAFVVLVVCGVVLAARSRDLFGFLVGTGIVTIIGLQATINVAVVTNSIPNKGMPLPFISYGGSNLVMMLAALGVLLNIFWQAQANAVRAGASEPGWQTRAGRQPRAKVCRA